MKGLSLTAGRNTRLEDLSDQHNKPLLDCGGEPLLKPFFEPYGILASQWQVRHQGAGQPFVVTTGDHSFALSRFQTLKVYPHPVTLSPNHLVIVSS